MAPGPRISNEGTIMLNGSFEWPSLNISVEPFADLNRLLSLLNVPRLLSTYRFSEKILMTSLSWLPAMLAGFRYMLFAMLQSLVATPVKCCALTQLKIARKAKDNKNDLRIMRCDFRPKLIGIIHGL